MKKILFIILAVCLTAIIVYAQTLINTKNRDNQNKYPKALVDYNDFKNLVTEVEKIRAERLISLDEFLKMSKEENVVILDSRSDFRFNRKHLKGAIHLDFTDYTQENLWKLIPDTNTKILIYCNNNFDGDQIDFASKMAMPKNNIETQILSNRKPIMLALNIPTYINLYGYGYRNIYELDELVNVNDTKIKFEGTEVK
jgi:uncharacterized protein YxeA